MASGQLVYDEVSGLRTLVALLLITVSLALAVSVSQSQLVRICVVYGMPENTAKRFTAELIEQCTLANMNPLIMFNLAIAESGLKNVIGDGGKAVGYFQLHEEAVWFVKSYYRLKNIPKDHKELLKNVDLQIKIAVLYMKYLLERHGSLESALKAWNGSARFVSYYAEVERYVKNVYLKN